MTTDLTPHRFDTPESFGAWLSENDDTSSGSWLVVAKKGSPMATITYRQALLAALAHGWIDGQARRLDDDSYLQRFTPRRPKSTWSLRNQNYVQAMIDEGTISPRGLAEVGRAKAHGRWDNAYEGAPPR